MESGLKSRGVRGLPLTSWEIVLPQALHSIRSLLCTATNVTPHERLFSYNRKSETGTTLPSWLTQPGTVLMKNNVRHSKYDPLVEEVMLIESNPQYALIRHRDGKESTVSIRQLAPSGNSTSDIDVSPDESLQDNPPVTQSTVTPVSSLPEESSISENSPQEICREELNCDHDVHRGETISQVQQEMNVNEIKEKQGRTHPYNLRSRNCVMCSGIVNTGGCKRVIISPSSEEPI